MLQTAHILRPRSCGHRCDARQGIHPRWAEWTQSQRPGKTFIEAVHTKMQLFWILSSCAHACVCVCVRMSDWPGLNFAKTARQLNISREAQMCQSRQKGLWWSHNFICQMSMKLNDFRDTLPNASILDSFKIDWKRCRKQRRAGVTCGWSLKKLRVKVYAGDVGKQRSALKIARPHLRERQSR